jgi:hypothetical protein
MQKNNPADGTCLQRNKGTAEARSFHKMGSATVNENEQCKGK